MEELFYAVNNYDIVDVDIEFRNVKDGVLLLFLYAIYFLSALEFINTPEDRLSISYFN